MLRIDADVVASFKEHAQERGYRTELNRVLRSYVLDAQP
ncbi:BrnA antitoxin family protein [uncultured Sphingomonas sp.]|nr:BrnA antitoxin family protein [uncultured Sphingomonas sp.]